MALGVAVTAAFLVPLAIFGAVDNDEGYYGLAAKLTFEGEVPYRDFFYPQAPLLPYVYGAWMQVFGISLEATRALSVVFTLALGALICRHAATRFVSLWIGALAVLAFASTRLVATWYSTTKTYALSTLLLFGAFMLLDREASARTPRRWLPAGVLLGLAMDVRLIFAATVPVFAVLLWRLPLVTRPRAAGHWAVGLALGLLPSLVPLIVAPSQFVFGNIGFHAVRSEGGLVGDFDQKLDIVSDVLSQPQYVALLLLAGIAVVAQLARRRPPPLAFWLAAALGLANLLPTPTYAQYACTTVPFLIFTALELVPPIRARLAQPSGARYRGGAFAVAIVLALAFAFEGMRGVEQAQRFNSSPTVFFDQATRSAPGGLADVIDAETVPGEPVLSFRPIYIFLSHADPVPGFENDFAPVAAAIGDMSEPDAERLKLITNCRLEALIREHGVRLIVGPVDSRWLWADAGRPWDEIVREAGYEPFDTDKGVTVWIRPEDAAVSGRIEPRLRVAHNESSGPPQVIPGPGRPGVDNWRLAGSEPTLGRRARGLVAAPALARRDRASGRQPPVRGQSRLRRLLGQHRHPDSPRSAGDRSGGDRDHRVPRAW
jgi:Dolichyl-phosphate-mannose-protein mannosyltransferase